MLRAMRVMPVMFGISLIVAVLTFAAGAARAGDRFTPPSFVSSDEHVQCRVVNVTGTSRTVDIEARDGLGNPVAQASCFPGSNPFTVFVAAGDVSTLRCPGPGPRYCHFKVAGAKTAIRGMMEVRDDTTDALIVAVPAQ